MKLRQSLVRLPWVLSDTPPLANEEGNASAAWSSYSRRLDTGRAFQIASLNLLIPDAELLHLPRDRHRKRFHKANVLRNFEMRDPAATEFPNLVLSGLLICFQLDPCEICLA